MSMLVCNEPLASELLGRDDVRLVPRWPVPARTDGGLRPPRSVPKGRLRVLVVDDHRDCANTLAKLVDLWGYDAKSAYSGEAGLALARAYRPHVLLLDIMMPTVSGIDLALQVRQQAGLKSCLLIAVSGRADAATRRQCEEVGVDLILLKPVNFANLQTLLALESKYRSLLHRDGQTQWLAAPVVHLTRRASPWRTRESYDQVQVSLGS